MILLSRLFVVVFLAAGLSACFMSKKPLVDDARSAAPFAKISYSEKGSTSDKPVVLVRKGKFYRVETDEGEKGSVRFIDLGGNLYLIEAGNDEEGLYLYALAKVDPAAKAAEGYKVIASEDDTSLPKGLERCDDGTDKRVCVSDIDAYIAYAKAAIAAGAKPDVAWQYTTE